jgi:membrane dipeptidase
MRIPLVLRRAVPGAALLAAAALPAQQPTTDPNMARALRVLAAQPVVDGHNDLPWRIREDTVYPMDVNAYDLRTRTPGMTDLARLKRGRVGGQFWSIYIPGERGDKAYRANGKVSSVPGYARVQLEQIDIARRVIARYPELQWALTADAVRRAAAAGRIGSLLGLEGGHAIENSLNTLRVYYELGARYMTLTHNVTLDWADAALDTARHGGLTAFGREVVREMNRLGMLVDLSHVSPGTMSDALDVTAAPVIFSHSGARACRPPAQRARLHPRPPAGERRRRDGAVRHGVRLGSREGGRRPATVDDGVCHGAPSRRQRRGPARGRGLAGRASAAKGDDCRRRERDRPRAEDRGRRSRRSRR